MHAGRATVISAAMVAVCLATLSGLPAAAQAPTVSLRSVDASLLRAQAPKEQVLASWPQFHNGIDRTGFQPAETILDIENVPDLAVEWTRTTTGDIWSSPAVVGGKVFVGSDNAKMYAFDQATGIKLWNYVTGDAVKSSPAVVGGVVYFGSDDKKVYAVDATTGLKKWSYKTGERIAESSPLVVNGIVYIGSRDGKFYALNALTGTLKWSFDTWAIWESAAYANGVIYFGSDESKLFALNATTGAVKWSVSPGGRVRCTPSVVNGTVYVGVDDGRLYAYNASTGALKWKTAVLPGDAVVRSSPAVWNGKVYIDTGEIDPMNSHVYAFDAVTGVELWSTQIADYSTSPAAVANGVVYTGSFDHQLHAFDATTGAKLWTSGFELMDGGIPGGPAVVDGMIFAGNLEGKMFAFGLP